MNSFRKVKLRAFGARLRKEKVHKWFVFEKNYRQV